MTNWAVSPQLTIFPRHLMTNNLPESVSMISEILVESVGKKCFPMDEYMGFQCFQKAGNLTGTMPIWQWIMDTSWRTSLQYQRRWPLQRVLESDTGMDECKSFNIFRRLSFWRKKVWNLREKGMVEEVERFFQGSLRRIWCISMMEWRCKKIQW